VRTLSFGVTIDGPGRALFGEHTDEDEEPELGTLRFVAADRFLDPRDIVVAVKISLHRS